MMRTAVLFLALVMTTPALATSLKIATLSPEGSFWMTAMREAADKIAEETDDRVRFRFYPGGVMGNDSAVLRRIRTGQLQGAAMSGGALASRAPDTQIYNLPLLFNNYDEVDYVRSRMDAELEKAFADSGFVTFGLAEGGFAYIMSKNRVASTADIRDQKVWAPDDDPAAQAASSTFGFSPTALSIGDVLTGLQTDLINTVTTSPVAAIALQWHSQINYITDLPLAYFYAMMAIDQRSFNRISAEDQKVVDNHMREAFRRIDEQNRKDNAEALTALQDQGIELVKLNGEQRKDWQDKTRTAADIYVEKAGISTAKLDQVQQLLQTYRSNHAE